MTHIQKTPVKIFDKGIKNIVAGGYHTMVLENEGYGQSVDWLTIDNNRGILTPGKKFTIKVQANDQKLDQNESTAYIHLLSNDPQNPSKVIKVTVEKLRYDGGLVFRPSTLNFDHTFVGQANKRKVTISNADTKSISIKQFAFDNAVFTHDLKLPVTLKSGEKIEKEFIFTPTKSGKIEASATILSDEGGLKVRNYSVSGTGLVAPSMVVSPNSFSTTLAMNKEKNLSLYISNKGGSPLSWNIKGATQKGGKSLTEQRIFDLSHFSPISKGQVDERKGIPVSKWVAVLTGMDIHGRTTWMQLVQSTNGLIYPRQVDASIHYPKLMTDMHGLPCLSVSNCMVKNSTQPTSVQMDM